MARHVDCLPLPIAVYKTKPIYYACALIQYYYVKYANRWLANQQ